MCVASPDKGAHNTSETNPTKDRSSNRMAVTDNISSSSGKTQRYKKRKDLPSIDLLGLVTHKLNLGFKLSLLHGTTMGNLLHGCINKLGT